MDDKYLQCFNFLVDAHKQASVRHEHEFGSTFTYLVGADWHQWFTSALGLLGLVFGQDSPHQRNLQRFYDRPGDYYKSVFDAALGVFVAAKSDYEGGYYLSLNRTVAGEVFADFVRSCQESLGGGQQRCGSSIGLCSTRGCVEAICNTE
jgi:hypothetical protein